LLKYKLNKEAEKGVKLDPESPQPALLVIKLKGFLFEKRGNIQ
jgi:hypothetical protein